MAVLDVMLGENLDRRAAEIGGYAMDLFRAVAERNPGRIAEVRGLGLMIGIELAEPGKDVWQKLMDSGFILNLTKDRILRLVPPLTIAQDDMENFARALEDAL
jgi:acetylornithine aminotransferase